MSKHLHSTEYVEIACEVRLVRERAVLLFNGTTAAWVPKSQIETPDEELEPFKTVNVLMARWCAEEKGFL